MVYVVRFLFLYEKTKEAELMRSFKIKKVFVMLGTLMIFMRAFSVRAYSSVGNGSDGLSDRDVIIQTVNGEQSTSLLANATWLDDELLRIDVFNQETGVQTSIAIRLRDYINKEENSPYVIIQAVDLDGNQSSIIQIRNPFYVPTNMANAHRSDQSQRQNSEDGNTITNNNSSSNSNIPEQRPDHLRPLTPDGSGTVVDNATDADGIEFFTITTEDGNDFFLIVDRQRATDNVYLLNTVTEEDLISLAQAGGREVRPVGSLGGDIPTPTHPTLPSNPHESDNDTVNVVEEEQTNEQQPAPTSDNSNRIIIVVIIIVVGGIAYYLKIYKKKNRTSAMDSWDEEDDEDFDDDLNYYLDDTEGGAEANVEDEE